MLQRVGIVAVGLAGAALMAGCGNGSNSTSTQEPISVTVTAAASQVDVNGQVSLKAQATNDAQGVKFSDPQAKTAGACSGAGLAAGQCGTVTKVDSLHATYTAPASDVVVVITATSVTDTSKSQSISITVNAAPTIPQPSSANLTATIGTAFSLTLGTGGTAPFTWKITSGTLPSASGLTLNSSANTGTAVISGTPTTSAVNNTLTLQVTDADNQQSTVTLTITVPIVITSGSPLVTGEVTQTGYTTGAMTFAGGSGTTASSNAWSVTSGGAALTAAGLSLNPTNGAVTGTPTAACSPCSFTVQVTDSVGGKGTKALDLTIVPQTAVAVPSTASLKATIGAVYSLTLDGVSGTGEGALSNWTVTSGTLPPGLSVPGKSSGTISGTPTDAATTQAFTVTATDSLGVTSLPSAPITISVAIPISTSSLPGGEVSAAYNGGALTANKGTGTGLVWSASGLPSWASINANNGTITGAAPVAGTSPVTVKVKDANGASGSAKMNLVINPQLEITSTGTLTAGVVNSPYNSGTGVALTASGGVGPLGNWGGPASGALPNGLTLNSSGVIQGTPQCPTGNFNFTVTLGPDADGVTATSQGLSISTATTPLAITTASIPSANVGTAYSQQLATSGGACSASVTWSVVGGTLPGWLNLSPGGLLSGTPGSGDAGGSMGFTVQATDGVTTITQALSITVVSPGVNNGQMSGPYAFLARGFDSAGKPIAMVGSFTVDGGGNITAGSMDVNSFATGPATNLSITSASSYSLGADYRGQLTLVTSAGTYSFDISMGDLFAFTPPLFVHIGHMIGHEANSAIAGVITAQDNTTFSLSKINGDWAFLSEGNASSSGTPVRSATAGRLTINSDASISQGVFDTNDNGTFDNGTAGPLTFASGSTLDSSGAIDTTTGRGTLTLPVSSGPTVHEAFYVVSAGLVYSIGIDAIDSTHSLFALRAMRQSATWCPSTGGCNFNTVPGPLAGSSVLYLQANSSSAGTSRAQVGVVGFTPAGAGTGTLSGGLDVNDGGTIVAAADNPISGDFTTAANGRTTLTSAGSNPPVVYVVDQNTILVLGSGTKVDAGQGTPQSNLPFSFVGGTGGYFCFGTQPPAVSAGSVLSGVQGLIPTSTTTVPANPYTFDKNSLSGGLDEDISVSTVTITADSTGRFTFNDGGPKVGYVVNFSTSGAFSQTIAIDVDPTNVAPSVIVNDKVITQIMLP